MVDPEFSEQNGDFVHQLHERHRHTAAQAQVSELGRFCSWSEDAVLDLCIVIELDVGVAKLYRVAQDDGQQEARDGIPGEGLCSRNVVSKCE